MKRLTPKHRFVSRHDRGKWRDVWRIKGKSAWKKRRTHQWKRKENNHVEA